MTNLFKNKGEHFFITNVYATSYDSALLIKKPLYNFLKNLKKYYSNFEEWFEFKLYSGSDFIELNTDRCMYVIHNEYAEIVGVVIVKFNYKENDFKICTLKVHDNYKNRGIGSILMDKVMVKIRYGFKSIEKEHRNIYIEFHSYFEDEFKPLLSKFKYKQISHIEDENNHQNNIIKYEYTFD